MITCSRYGIPLIFNWLILIDKYNPDFVTKLEPPIINVIIILKKTNFKAILSLKIIIPFNRNFNV